MVKDSSISFEFPEEVLEEVKRLKNITETCFLNSDFDKNNSDLDSMDNNGEMGTVKGIFKLLRKCHTIFSYFFF